MSGHRRKILIALIILAALALLAYHSRNRIHAHFTWSKFSSAVSQANIWLLLLSLVAIYGCYAIRALRWQRFSRYLGPSQFVDMYSATVMGFAAILVLSRVGEATRPLLVARKCRLPVAGMFGILVLERICDFAAAVGLVTLSLLVFSSKLSDAGANTDWIEAAREGGFLLLAMLLGVILLLVYFRLHGAGVLERLLEKWHKAAGWRGWVATVAGGFSQGLQAIRSPADLLLAVAYSAAHWALVALVYLWICRSFGDAFPHSTMNYPGAMLLLAVTLVGATVQLPGVGGGAQVLSMIALTTIFQVDQEPAVAIALVLWLITFAAPALVGIPMLIHEGLSMGDLRKLARAEVAAEEAGKHLSLTGIGWSDPGKGKAGSGPAGGAP
jgi:uncharacterized protein (TIRG00374 family)